MRAKVALAVAVIKTKPPGMSSREYAEALAHKLRRQDEERKEKARGLQQELLITRVTLGTKSCTEAADDDGMNTSQELFGPGCSGPDSNSETPDLLLPEPVFIPPPPPGHCGGSLRDVVVPHVSFLQSLCSLLRLKGSSGDTKALTFGSDGFDSDLMLGDTVGHLLDSVVAACSDPPALGPSDLLLQACQVASSSLDMLCSRRRPPVAFRTHVETALRKLTQMLLHSTQPSRAQQGFGLDLFPLDWYQNSSHLFWILEELLQDSEVVGLGLEEELRGFLGFLEQKLFVLSEEFPLFSIWMWRVGSLLTVEPGQRRLSDGTPGSL
ncbi:meiosis-specific protein MEI4 isoform X3 [Nothobranchius furzeri]